MDYGIAETGIARGSPPGTTTEVLRFGVPFTEIRVISGAAPGGDRSRPPQGRRGVQRKRRWLGLAGSCDLGV
jgi:hypothetical protein